MKILREYIRELLTESIDPRIVKQIDQTEEAGYKVVVYDDRNYGFAEIVEGEEGYSTYYSIAKVSWTYNDGQFGECNKAAWVAASFAHDDLGPLVYDIAIEVSGGLMSDRTEVTDVAEAVWQKYMNSRDDVQQDQLDIFKDYGFPQLTKDNPDDDCEQVPAVQKYKGDWHKSALSKAYFKSGTPVVDELRKRGMLIEK